MLRREIVRISVPVLILGTLIVGFATAGGFSQYMKSGQLFRGATETAKNDNDIVATYKDYKVFQAEVDYQKKVYSTDNSIDDKSDSLNIINRIITGYILLEEAEMKGYSATDEEIEEMVAMAKESYSIPEGRAILDDYCRGAGITIEEYYDILKEQAPAAIARQKLRNAFDEEY